MPQGRGTFTELTVEDNLRAGVFVRARRRVEADIAPLVRCVPSSRNGAPGGDPLRRRAADARDRPGADEPAPVVAVRRAEPRPRSDPRAGDVRHTPWPEPRDGLSVLLVEQNANLALEIANRVYLLEVGQSSLRRRRRAPRTTPFARHTWVLMQIFLDPVRRPQQRRDLRPPRAGPRHRLPWHGPSTSPRARWRCSAPTWPGGSARTGFPYRGVARRDRGRSPSAGHPKGSWPADQGAVRCPLSCCYGLFSVLTRPRLIWGDGTLSFERLSRTTLTPPCRCSAPGATGQHRRRLLFAAVVALMFACSTGPSSGCDAGHGEQRGGGARGHQVGRILISAGASPPPWARSAAGLSHRCEGPLDLAG